MTATNFPASAPVVGPDGRLSPVWFQFFQTLFDRTGGASDMTNVEAIALPRSSRPPDKQSEVIPLREHQERHQEVAAVRAQRARQDEGRIPARHAQLRLVLTKESYKPLTLIRLYIGAGADIPAGWQLADGTAGTPNMKDLFVVGAGDLYAQGSTGGSTTITANNLPAHTHPYHDANTTYTANTVAVQSGAGTTVVQSLTAAPSDTPRTTDANTTTAAAYLPPYYAAAYIINTKTVTIVTDAKLR